MDKAHPAATVVLMRESENGYEVLLVKRSEELDFCGGAWVFPGGSVDPGDYRQAKSSELVDAIRIAAVREVFEETAIRIEADQLLLMEHFTTPSSSPKRFSTYFFITSIEDTKVRVDGSEILEYRWMSPQTALAEHEKGHIYLVIPTMIILDRIASYSDIKAVLEQVKQADPQYY